jgi:hypothetical protein
MLQWILLIALVGVVLALALRRREGFIDFSAQQRFGDHQDTYFHDQISKGIFVNPGLVESPLNSDLTPRNTNVTSLQGLEAAIGMTDLYLPTSTQREYGKYLITDPENTFTEADKSFCAGATQPKNMPPVVAGSRVGCGWYYYDDARPSVGALGTRDGPIFTDALRGGEYIWDRAAAQKREEIKKCRNVRSCEVLDSVRGDCGFCKQKGHAVPVNSNGAVKYTDASCGVPVSLTKDSCLARPVVTSDGVSCGSAGRPSLDGTLRLYTKAECDALGGNWSTNGTCMKLNGSGSFSAECAALNAPPRASEDICAPDAVGKLSVACLKSIAALKGCGESGGAVRIIANNGNMGATDKLAIATLAENGLTLPSALWSRNIGVQEAADVFERIVATTRDMRLREIVRGAATWMAIGGNEFDPCKFGSDDSGPFPTACLQRAFRAAGCQAGGTAYPRESTIDAATKTWKQVNDEYTARFAETRSGDPTKQDAALRSCLGVGSEFARPPKKNCYRKTEFGYDEGSADKQSCFSAHQAWFLTVDQAKARCDADPQCKGFSFPRGATRGGGCFMRDKIRYNPDSRFEGYTKIV